MVICSRPSECLDRAHLTLTQKLPVKEPVDHPPLDDHKVNDMDPALRQTS